MSSLIDPRPQDSGRQHRLRIVGELDVATGPDEFVRIIATRPEQGDTIELDLTDVTFIDSSGVAMLMKAKSYLEGGGCNLVLTNLSPSAYRLLDMLGLTDTFAVDNDSSTTKTH
jgi:anti-sigma B factor antagonist